MNKNSTPVLLCSAEGDQEGRTNKSFGYFQGKIEDILRFTAPKATHAEARFGAKYEMSADYFESAEAVYKYLSTQMGISKKEQHPHITSVKTQKPLSSKVAVHVDNTTQFTGQLLPQTSWERQNYADGKPSNILVIDL